MSEMHSSPDRVVWFDLPVADLARASKFYGPVLGIKVEEAKAGNFTFAVLEHGPNGNGGCLIPNVDGRIRDALRQTEKHGGRVVKAIESIGPHGFRAIVLDSEGNRIALHSGTDK